MSRLAILLGNPKAKDAPIELRGVDNDMEYWERFLESKQGGLWEKDSEIKRLNPQSKQELFPYIANLRKERKLDYLLFVFAGHGKSDDNNDYIYVDPQGEPVSVSALKEIMSCAACSGLLFLDACRTTDLIYHTSLDIQSLYSGVMNCSSEQQNTDKDGKIKDKIVEKWWNKWATGDADSFVVIQSCNREKSAVEVHELKSDEYYGAFTKMMLDTAYAASTYTDSYKCFQDANDKMKESLDWSKCDGYTQQATYEPRGKAHPFALGLDTIKKIQDECLLVE